MDVDALRAKAAAEYGVSVDAVSIAIPERSDDRITLLVNSNVKMSPHKLAAQAVHAALAHYGIAHGAVVVLGASPSKIRSQCDVVIQDAGVTELAPGTLTCGVRRA
jgi:PTH2 family peptidyl-tRNA hydrolase